MKKHRIRNIFALFLLLFAACGIVGSAFHLTVEREPVQPVPITARGEGEIGHAARCALCRDGRALYAETTRTPWRTDYYLDCPHGDQRARDKLQRRTDITSYACDGCDYGEDRLATEERVVCLSQH